MTLTTLFQPNLQHRYTTTADGGTYAVTGQSARGVISLATARGTFALAGQSARGVLSLAGARGDYAVAGGAARPRISLAAAQAAYVTAGGAARGAIAFPAGGGAYVIVGIDANMGGAAHYFMTADPGSIALAGSGAVGIIRSAALTRGQLVLVGGVVAGRIALTSGRGSLVVSGTSVTTILRLLSARGGYSVVGTDTPSAAPSPSITLLASSRDLLFGAKARTLIVSARANS